MARRPAAPRRPAPPARHRRPGPEHESPSPSRSPESQTAAARHPEAQNSTTRNSASQNSTTQNSASQSAEEQNSASQSPASRLRKSLPRKTQYPKAQTPARQTRAQADSARPSAAASPREPASSAASPGATSGVVHAAERFRALVRPRPWRRRRRTLILIGAGFLAFLLAAVLALLLLPTFQVRTVQVTGTRYVDPAAVRAVAEDAEGTSIVLVPSGDIEKRAAAVPGIRSATLTRTWPDAVTLHVTERTPLASVAHAGGGTSIVDAEGVTLPAAAGRGAHLTPLTVGAGSKDSGSATRAMLAVLAALPADLRSQVTGITATTASDVTLTIRTGSADGKDATSKEAGAKADASKDAKTPAPATKQVVWGDPDDSAVKAKVTAALLDRPGTVIDVSSPVAPVTR